MPPGNIPGWHAPYPSISVVQTKCSGTKKKLDEVKGIGSLPTVAGFSQWRTNTRYANASASGNPNAALSWLLQAKRWKGPIEDPSSEDSWDALNAKTGKALRAVAKGELLNEKVIIGERMLRKHERLLDGRVMYAIVMSELPNDPRRAKPLAVEKWQRVKVQEG